MTIKNNFSRMERSLATNLLGLKTKPFQIKHTVRPKSSVLNSGPRIKLSDTSINERFGALTPKDRPEQNTDSQKFRTQGHNVTAAITYIYEPTHHKKTGKETEYISGSKTY